MFYIDIFEAGELQEDALSQQQLHQGTTIFLKSPIYAGGAA
jgi:hypothetical protein